MISDIVLSDDLARQIGVRPGVVMSWAQAFRRSAGSGVMLLTAGGTRRCVLSLPATIGILALAMPLRRRQSPRWADLMGVACERLRDLDALQEPVTDAAVALLTAALELGRQDIRR